MFFLCLFVCLFRHDVSLIRIDSINFPPIAELIENDTKQTVEELELPESIKKQQTVQSLVNDTQAKLTIQQTQ